MDIQQVLQARQQKQQLLQKRDKLIKAHIKKKRSDQINLDQSSIKKGFIEKTKIIRKKQFEVVTQKARQIHIPIQKNVSVNTFLTESSSYKKVLERTKKKIVFDPQVLMDCMLALTAFAKISYEKTINLTVTFKKEILCSARPFQM